MFEERLAPVLQQLDSDERELGRVTSILRFCSPAMLFESISDDLAGTGRVRWRRFLEQMDAHVRSHSTTPFVFREEATAELARRLGPRITALFLAPWIVLLASWVYSRHPGAREKHAAC